ncbi:DMT family transporter [Thermodesulfobacteriota bacterium]
MKSKPLSHKNLSPVAVLSATALAVLFGANAVAIKVSLVGLGEFTTAGLRFGLAALVISCWTKATGGKLIVPRRQFIPLLNISIIFLIQLGLIYAGLGRTNASRATLIINFTPFITLILAHFFIPGDQLTKRKAVGMILGFAGLVILFLKADEMTSDLRIGDIMILIAAIIWASNTVYTKHVLERIDPVPVTLYPMAFSAPFFIIGGYFWDEKMIGQLNPEIIGAFLYQAFVTASFGFVIWNAMIKRYGATAIHSFIFIMPITGVLLGVLLLGEPVTFNMLTAVVLIAAGILVIHYQLEKPIPTPSIRSGI